MYGSKLCNIWLCVCVLPNFIYSLLHSIYLLLAIDLCPIDLCVCACVSMHVSVVVVVVFFIATNFKFSRKFDGDQALVVPVLYTERRLDGLCMQKHKLYTEYINYLSISGFSVFVFRFSQCGIDMEYWHEKCSYKKHNAQIDSR